MRRPASFLGGLTPEAFLRDYWQKKPLLVRGALPDCPVPLSAEELAGLALEADVESRVVSEREGRFQLQRGPFDERFFAQQPESHWTLLVQDLDQHVEACAELFGLLDFLPSYRLDDVMVSYAAPGGSVGPHFDQYDVFLVQVEGRRRWQITDSFDRDALRTDTELCVLSAFEPSDEWLLAPGDLLYLPPNVAHFGVAEGSCMTVSLGCRAPSVAEIVAHFATRAVERLDERQRYTDPDLEPSGGASSLDSAALKRVAGLLNEHLEFAPDAIARGFGTLVTQPKALFAQDPVEIWSREHLAAELARGLLFGRRIGSRWLHHAGQTRCYLFVDGLEFEFPKRAEAITVALSTESRHDATTLERWLEDESVSEEVWRLLELGLLESFGAP